MRLNLMMKISLCLFALFPLSCAEFKQAGRDVGHSSRDVTRQIGHGTRDAVKSIGHTTRDAVKTVGKEVKKATSSDK